MEDFLECKIAQIFRVRVLGVKLFDEERML